MLSRLKQELDKSDNCDLEMRQSMFLDLLIQFTVCCMWNFWDGCLLNPNNMYEQNKNQVKLARLYLTVKAT